MSAEVDRLQLVLREVRFCLDEVKAFMTRAHSALDEIERLLDIGEHTTAFTRVTYVQVAIDSMVESFRRLAESV